MKDSYENPPSGEIVVYEAKDGNIRVDVHIEDETVWLTQRQLADVYDTSIDNVSLHLRNIYTDEELQEDATTEDFSIVQSEGDRQVRRTIQHYNLDAIVSVGYRINSKRAVRFRQWATRTLRDHLALGYTLNERRLAERGVDEAREMVNLLARTLRNQSLVDEAGRAVVELIERYTETWRIFLQYDEDQLVTPPNVKPSTTVLDLDRVVEAITTFKLDLVKRGEASPLFGTQREDGLKAILGNVEQTMFGESLYSSREQKAANLLYFVVKDHPFTDGNKRIGALLFLLYLTQEGIPHEINPTTLTALTLLIAESEPVNKDLIIRLVMNLLTTTSR